MQSALSQLHSRYTTQTRTQTHTDKREIEREKENHVHASNAHFKKEKAKQTNRKVHFAHVIASDVIHQWRKRSTAPIITLMTVFISSDYHPCGRRLANQTSTGARVPWSSVRHVERYLFSLYQASTTFAEPVYKV